MFVDRATCFSSFPEECEESLCAPCDCEDGGTEGQTEGSCDVPGSAKDIPSETKLVGASAKLFDFKISIPFWG